MKKIEVTIRMSKVSDVITALSQVGYQSAEISDVEERERGKGPDENPQEKPIWMSSDQETAGDHREGRRR